MNITFPHFTVLKASAGSGKTRALTEQFVRFLLSDEIPRNTLHDILAITFSNNAAKEMKERILLWLKQIALSDSDSKTQKAERLLHHILENYSDFQIKTIDSFMATIFKACAIDLGYHPDFDILMSNDALMEFAFDLFLRKVKEGTEEAELMQEIITNILKNKDSESSYLWDPSQVILEEIKHVYRKLASIWQKVTLEDLSPEMAAIEKRIKEQAEVIEEMIERSELIKSKSSSYQDVLMIVRAGSFPDLIEKGFKNSPVKKPGKKDSAGLEWHAKITDEWNTLHTLIKQYIFYFAHTFYSPYIKIYEKFSGVVENAKKQQGKVFIEDINKKLTDFLNKGLVPDIFFRIGETIFHYLIDEFQDTSPIQWNNLFPLIENSLSQGGSLFVVGDAKQAIYGFRDADFSIMKRAESENPFPSATHRVATLETNYRSLQVIVDFNEKVFKKRLADNRQYGKSAEMSGLIDYEQRVKEENKGTGYVETVLFEKNSDAPEEKQKIQGLIDGLIKRGYKYRDIALLTTKNEDVARAAVWLNEKKIPLISYSSLDIRKRKITGEIFSLLKFLDSPIDDLSFAAFVLGDVFSGTLAYEKGLREQMHTFFFKNRNNTPLYKAFQKEFGELWEASFKGLFKSAGYSPLYDLVTDLFYVFKVFERFDNEEAALAKILEVIKGVEEKGNNNLRDFLDFAFNKADDGHDWNIDAPSGIDAVKVMTVHKAKGLGFPVVIVLLYGEQNKGFKYIVKEKEDDSEVCLIRVNKNISLSHPAFTELYNRERVKEEINRLNTLYVGLTRAQAEMYVIGVKGKRDAYHPFAIIPETVMGAPLAKVCENTDNGEPAQSEVDITKNIAPLHHHSRIPLAGGSHEMINIEEKERGEFIHRALSFIEYIEEGFETVLEQIVKRVNKERGERRAVDDIKREIWECICDEKIKKYFIKKPRRTVKNEQEFSDAAGRLFRMDRVINDADTVTVMDYKTGKDNKTDKRHRSQMEGYINILKEIYPNKRVEGILVYIDHNSSATKTLRHKGKEY